jgi:DNA cross-link repair 1C protein
MPPGTPFNAFALPYRIRVDAFTQLPSQDVQPSLHLLTHTHTDHVNGLASKSFGSVVYCSRDAKEMLLKHESSMERELYHEQLIPEKMRMYSHLKVVPVTRPDGSRCFIGARDLLVRGFCFVVLMTYSCHVEDFTPEHAHYCRTRTR